MISCSDGTGPTAPFLCASSTQDLSQVFNQVWNLHKDNDKYKDKDKDKGPIAGLQPGWNVVSISIMVKIVYDDHHENYYSVFNLVYSRFEIDIEGATPKVKVFSNPRSL